MLLEKVQMLLQEIQKKDGQDSKRPVIQSPRVQSSRVHVYSRPESRAESKRPDHTSKFQFFRYAFSNIVIQTIYCNSFCNNVETSLTCWFIAAFHMKLGTSKIDCGNKI